ncbi:carboxypeptidase-like regulatory domain-containing protein [Methanosphaera sp.]|uniref:carboxypeptidase-like regulatory domain-containing protein n=1 Tax=Methanosphaera sp. TaxID=2666342 RepID=UPI0026DF0F23|nr:carboxypeptidase-like regulatory domain-containing protein [Methanosphaera sp.]MDO5821821.1 carboxypeptidase-like regulatory domain-containing protein [Methanosphaera sp.]
MTIYTNIKVEATNTKVNKTNIIKVTLTNGNGLVGEKVVLIIDDKKYNLITKENGVATFTTYSSSIERNKVLVTVEYFGNENIGYDSCISSTEFNVEKLNTKITVNQISNAIIGQNITLTGNLTDEFGHIVSNENIVLCFEKDNKNITVSTNSNGTYTFTYNVYREGSFDVIIYYYGNTALNPSSIGFHTYVVKINTNITVNPVANTTVDKNVSIKGTLKDEFGNIMPNTNIKIRINNETYQVTTDAQGEYEYIYKTTMEDTLDVTVAYHGNNTHNPSIIKTSFNVRKLNTTLSIIPSPPLKDGDKIYIMGYLEDENKNPIANATITITFGNKVYNVTTDDKGKYTAIEIANSSIQQGVVVAYIGDNKYATSLNKTEYYVDKIYTKISVNNIDQVPVGSTVTINGTLKDEFGHVLPNTPIEIDINGKTIQFVTDENGNYAYNYTISEMKKASVSVSYLGNSTYYSSDAQTAITVRKIKTTITLDPVSDIPYGKNITISGILKDEFGKPLSNVNISVVINGEVKSSNVTTDNNGKYSMNVTKSNVGIKNIIVSYDGNLTHYASSNSSSLNVTTINTTITVNTTHSVKIGSSIIINGVLKDVYGNILPNTEVIIVVNGKEYTIMTNNEGYYEMPYTTYIIGSRLVLVKYLGNSTYNPTSNQTNFYVNPINTAITVSTNLTNGSVKFGQSILINGTVYDEFGNILPNTEVSIIIDEETYTTTSDANGKYQFIRKSQSIGIKKVIVQYNGNYTYNPSSNEIYYTVIPLNTKIVINHVEDIKIGSSTYINGTIYDEFGNILPNTELSFLVNDNLVYNLSDSEGNFKFKYTPETAGIINVIVGYIGNSTHNPSANTTSFNVNKINTKLTVTSNNTIEIGKNTSIEGTLKDEFGNIMANTKVVLTVNNQMVSLVTDEFGHYTYDYITNVLGTNEVYVIYEGNNSHDYSTNVTSFNVRKISSIIDVNKISTIVIGNNVTVNGTLKDEFGNKLVNTTISLNINDKTVNVTTDNNGNYKYTFQTNKIEVNTIDVSYSGNDSYLSANTRVAFDVRKILTDVDINNISDVKINSNVVINGTLYDEYGNVMKNTPIKLIINNQTYNITTDNNGNYKYTYKVNSLNNTVEVVYLGNNTHDASHDITLFTANKLKTTVTVYPASGIIGENITLIAKITDEYGNLVNGGNLVFKLNGKTLREDGSFNSTANPLKLKVENGFVRYNLHLDMYLRNIKNVTASYSGSYIYESARAQEATVIVGKRMTQLNVTTSTTTVKQNTNITFTVKIADITPNAENRTINTGRVIFKINGKTIKDDDGNIVFSDIINNTATYTYHIPQGMASVDKNNTLRNYTVEAVYADKIYQETKNTTVFHVEKSDISIDINNVSISKTDKTMNVTAKILDYQGNFVVGTNKICLKVNGVTLKDENNQTIYYTINNGVIDLKNIIIPVKNVNNITIVTGDRQAYNSGCNTTDVIFIKE